MNAAHMASETSENPFSLNPSPQRPSALNALKHGLFAAHDFIRDGEHEEHAETFAALTRELSPAGVLETTFTTEIMGATWRLRRCRLIESALAASTDAGSINEEAVARQQKSVDRARAQTFTRLCRSISELRKIQTEHIIREQIDAEMPGLADSRQVLSAVKLQNRVNSEARRIPDPGHNPAAFDAFLARVGQPAPPAERKVSFCNEPETPAEPAISFCKPAPVPAAQPKNTPRNAPCPCRSGLKFKKCCARGGAKWSALSPKTASSGPVPLADVPPVLTMAA